MSRTDTSLNPIKPFELPDVSALRGPSHATDDFELIRQNTPGDEQTVLLEQKIEEMKLAKQNPVSTEAAEGTAPESTGVDAPAADAAPATSTEESAEPAEEAGTEPKAGAAVDPAAETNPMAADVAPDAEATTTAAPTAEADWQNDGKASFGSVMYSVGKGFADPLIAAVHPAENFRTTAITAAVLGGLCFTPAAPVVGGLLMVAAAGFTLWGLAKAAYGTYQAINTGNWDNLEKGAEGLGSAALSAIPVVGSGLRSTRLGAAVAARLPTFTQGTRAAAAAEGFAAGANATADITLGAAGKIVSPARGLTSRVTTGLTEGIVGGLKGVKKGVMNPRYTRTKNPVTATAAEEATAAATGAADDVAAASTGAADDAAAAATGVADDAVKVKSPDEVVDLLDPKTGTDFGERL